MPQQSNPTVTIREATPADQPALLQLYRTLQAYECALHPNRDDPEKVTEPHWRHLEHQMAEHQGKVWLAEDDTGAPLGFILVLIEACEPYLIESDRISGYVSDIIVDEAARGQGVGEALMATAENFFRAEGLSQMRVGVLCNNHAARRFYENLAMQPYEMFYEKRLDDLAVPEVTL